ncbi:MAG: UDP-2,3-diacylglucosamine diphosphatase [Candidatus Marinimicrobia bacterium]|nr:UDP-2,3-diacylglucosamine diphosphatase [Candidatus Neomarinimicrobiota bacterium]
MKINKNKLSLENNNNLKLPFYFISDTHFSTILSEHEIKKRKKIFPLFDKIIEEQGTLFILGDFFDFWFDCRKYIHPNLKIIVEYLEKIKKSGVEIHYIAGNHDYWIKGILTKKVGVIFYPDSIEFNYKNKKILLMHGDGLLKRDGKYRIFKKVLRSKFMITMFKILPIFLIYKLGEKVSNIRKRYNNSLIDENDIYEMIEYLEMKNSDGFDIAMMGHIHLPKIKIKNNKYAIILGDWISHKSYAIWDGKEVSHFK